MWYFRNNMARNAKDVYFEHAALVRGAARCADAKGNFLEYDVTQGWEPLCEFLGLPIPDEDFPSGNVADEFHKRVEGSMKPRFIRGIRNLVLGTAVVIGGGVYGWMTYGDTVREVVAAIL